MQRREDSEEMSSDFQVMEAERVRLSVLDEKIKEVLAMLRALNEMVCFKACFKENYRVIAILDLKTAKHSLET